MNSSPEEDPVAVNVRFRYREHMSEFAREFEAKGKAEGKADGLTEGMAMGMAEGIARGVALGEAKVVLAYLGARGVRVSEEARERIMRCTDLEWLDVWLKRATTVAHVDELFRSPDYYDQATEEDG